MYVTYMFAIVNLGTVVVIGNTTLNEYSIIDQFKK